MKTVRQKRLLSVLVSSVLGMVSCFSIAEPHEKPDCGENQVAIWNSPFINQAGTMIDGQWFCVDIDKAEWLTSRRNTNETLNSTITDVLEAYHLALLQTVCVDPESSSDTKGLETVCQEAKVNAYKTICNSDIAPYSPHCATFK